METFKLEKFRRVKNDEGDKNEEFELFIYETYIVQFSINQTTIFPNYKNINCYVFLKYLFLLGFSRKFS